MIRRTRKPGHMTQLRGRIKILCYLRKRLRHPTEEVSNWVDFVLQQQPTASPGGNDWNRIWARSCHLLA